MMVASKGPELLTSPDKDLYDLVSVITAPAERYASRVYSAQGEAARGSMQFDKALASANITGAARSVQNVLLAYEPGVAPRQGGTMAFEWDKLLRMEALPAMLQT